MAEIGQFVLQLNFTLFSFLDVSFGPDLGCLQKQYQNGKFFTTTVYPTWAWTNSQIFEMEYYREVMDLCIKMNDGNLVFNIQKGNIELMELTSGNENIQPVLECDSFSVDVG